MKRMIAVVLLAGVSLAANAVPIPFTYIGSSISATGALALSTYHPSFDSVGNWSGGSTDFGYLYMGNAGTARLTATPISSRSILSWPSFTFSGSIMNYGSEATVTPVPEPGMLSMIGLGLAIVGVVAGVRRRSQS